jgi:hypothetical protein
MSSIWRVSSRLSSAASRPAARVWRAVAVLLAPVACHAPSAVASRADAGSYDAPSPVAFAEASAGRPYPQPQLSDQQLRALLGAPIGPNDMDLPPEVVGYLGEAPVRSAVLCADL